MKYKLLLLVFLAASQAHAQDAPMADQLRADGKIWVVVATLTVLLLGFLFYLISVDRRVSSLEKDKQK